MNNDINKGSGGNGHQARLLITPPVDVHENDDELVVTADVPGATADSVRVELEHDRLVIFARSEATAQGRQRGRDYQRAFRVPEGIDGGAIAAELKQGVLRVRLPKSPALKPRVIPVRSS